MAMGFSDLRPCAAVLMRVWLPVIAKLIISSDVLFWQELRPKFTVYYSREGRALEGRGGCGAFFPRRRRCAIWRLPRDPRRSKRPGRASLDIRQGVCSAGSRGGSDEWRVVGGEISNHWARRLL